LSTRHGPIIHWDGADSVVAPWDASYTPLGSRSNKDAERRRLLCLGGPFSWHLIDDPSTKGQLVSLREFLRRFTSSPETGFEEVGQIGNGKSSGK
jgi:hypothetical protein